MELSINESLKTILKSSKRNILFITFIFILPLTLFQTLFVSNLLEIVILVSNQNGKSMISSYFIYNFVYLVLFLIFYLLSTSSVIFTMASLYVSKPVSCISTLLAIPRLSKRILITFLHALPLMTCTYLANFAHLFLILNVIAKMNDTIAFIFAEIYCLFVTYANVYIMALWNLASVISVLDPNVQTSSAMKMSKQLLRGNTRDAFLFVCLYSIVAFVVLRIEKFVVCMDFNNYIIARILLAFCVIIMSGVNFIGLIGQTVLYFACKNYHNQVVDKEVLYAHLAGKESGNMEV